MSDGKKEAPDTEAEANPEADESLDEAALEAASGGILIGLNQARIGKHLPVPDQALGDALGHKDLQDSAFKFFKK